MAEDSQVIPLAPVRINRSNEEQEVPAIKPNTLVQQKSSKCLVYMLSTIVILSIFMLILGLTILRVNSPDVRLRPVEIKNLRHGRAPSPPSLDMNVVAEVVVDNTNFGPFKFHNSSSAMFYGNVTVGVTNINSGHINARDKKRINITFPVRSNKLLDNMNFSSDVSSRLVPLSSYAELKGEVQVMKIINSRRTSIMNCTMELNLTSQAFQGLRCN